MIVLITPLFSSGDGTDGDERIRIEGGRTKIHPILVILYLVVGSKLSSNFLLAFLESWMPTAWQCSVSCTLSRKADLPFFIFAGEVCDLTTTPWLRQLAPAARNQTATSYGRDLCELCPRRYELPAPH